MEMSKVFTLPLTVNRQGHLLCGEGHNISNYVSRPEHVSHAINCHDELVEALESVMSAINNRNPDAYDQLVDAEKKVAGVLSKAKG